MTEKAHINSPSNQNFGTQFSLVRDARQICHQRESKKCWQGEGQWSRKTSFKSSLLLPLSVAAQTLRKIQLPNKLSQTQQRSMIHRMKTCLKPEALKARARAMQVAPVSPLSRLRNQPSPRCLKSLAASQMSRKRVRFLNGCRSIPAYGTRRTRSLKLGP